MATEDRVNLDTDSPEDRLLQFLYVGKEYLNYQPGNWFFHNYFLAKNIPSIEELAEDAEKQLIPIKLITKAFESKLIPNPETLVFALAVCCRQMKSDSLRHTAYLLVEKICVTPQHFMLFIKFASQLNKQKELNLDGTNGTSGWGHGLRKAVNNWYLSKNPLDLAKCVTRYKGRYGWKHKDIIKLCHPYPNKPGMEVVLKYIMHGLEETKEAFKGDSKFTDILNYIDAVEDFKHCQDEIRAAGLLNMYRLTLDHVPGHLLKSTEVWNSLISTMDLVTLLNSVQRIHNFEMFKQNSPTIEKVIDRIVDEHSVAESRIHPAQVLITIRNYENSGKPLTHEKRKIKAQVMKSVPVSPNGKIVNALYRTLNLSFRHLEQTDQRYMITIDMNSRMLNTRAWGAGNVSGAEAGGMIAIAVLHSARKVRLAIFGDNMLNTVVIKEKATFNQVMAEMRRSTVGNANLGKPMYDARDSNMHYDVFINVVDQILEKRDKSQEALISYRERLNLPKTKLINCAVCSARTYRKDKYDRNILTINGFDATVPVIIQAFADSLF